MAFVSYPLFDPPTPMGLQPTLSGFIEFVQNVMKPPAPFDATTSLFVQYAYNYAVQFANQNLSNVQGLPGVWSLYAMAVYNLAANTLINFAQDPPGAPLVTPPNGPLPGLPYWASLRKSYGVLNFVAGVVSSTSDEGTSSSYEIPEQFKNYTIANLQNLKTPYGRQYLSIAGSWGSLWGLS